MKGFAYDFFLTVLIGAVLSLSVGLFLNFPARDTASAADTPQFTEVNTQIPRTIMLRIAEDASITINMDQYLTGVVLAEVPVSFEDEAIKAQAVVARTYAEKAKTTGGKHGDGSICTDYTCCQGYVSPNVYLQKTGDLLSLERISQLVADTSGMILTYRGAEIEATYFSCSGGRTEKAEDVWGIAYPYLQSVDSPGEDAAECFSCSTSYLIQDLAELLGLTQEDAKEITFDEWSYTSGGGVSSVRICGQLFTGSQLRRILNLRSTMFDAELLDECAVFHTKGYGHRVGMSQYGAQAQAKTGKTYPEILAYYYPGTELKCLGAET